MKQLSHEESLYVGSLIHFPNPKLSHPKGQKWE